MIRRIASQKRHLAVTVNSESFLLFSYGDYFEPENVHWGGLRIFNDDLIHPGHGFPVHVHDEIELVTILLAGELRQRTEMLPSSRLRPGDVQALSAGRGFHHTDCNEGDGPVHFYQIGIFPRIHGLTPSLVQAAYDRSLHQNNLLPVASGQEKDGALVINADATVYLGSLDPCRMLDHTVPDGYAVFCYVTRGSLNINGVDFGTGDQARVADEYELAIGAVDHSEFVLVETFLKSRTG